MAPIPRDPSPDSTLALLSEGYTFILRRCQRLQSDIFETRLMFRKVICVMGEDAAEMFYAADRFTRKRALPRMSLLLLQDRGSVQLLDGLAHRHRKQMFMSLMTPAHVQLLADRVAQQWRAQIPRWETMREVVLLHEVQEILCQAVCQWAGIPLTPWEAQRRTREFAAMVEGAGTVGPRNWRGQFLRARTERWIRAVVRQVRSRQLDVPAESAAYAIAWHRTPNGKLLDVRVAAVELINVLRPTVAVAWYVIFAALALHEYPRCRQKILDQENNYLNLFVQEVRRLYPFFPAVGGRVQKAFEWRGHHFAPGTWVLLDLYATNHDARIWDKPDSFRPERFRDWNESPFSLIPQGGGTHEDGHRCAGEWITITLMETAVHLLTTAMQYEVPEQDLRIDLTRIPAIPKSRFIISNVQRSD